MIKVYIKNDGNKKGIVLEGHAEYDEHGKDILCASVSTIFELASMGLRQLANQYPDYIQIKESIDKNLCGLCDEQLKCNADWQNCDKHKELLKEIRRK